jgi:hypothetical protein
MKAYIDSTGKLLFTSEVEMEIDSSTIMIEGIPTGNYWDFETNQWVTIIDEEMQANLIQQALEIDLYYTSLISDLLKKHIEKKLIENIDIPQYVLDERDRLRTECNNKIIVSISILIKLKISKNIFLRVLKIFFISTKLGIYKLLALKFLFRNQKFF